MEPVPPTCPPEISEDHARYWRAWRSRRRCASWYASKRAGAPAAWAPTLAADTLVELERQMTDPPKRIGASLPDLVAPR